MLRIINYIRFTFLVWAATLVVSGSPLESKADTLTLVADEWCPYNCAPESDKPGFMVEVAQFAFKKTGHKIEYKIMPWARAIEESRAGNFSGIIGAFKEDAPDFVFPAYEISQASSDFFVLAKEPWRYSAEASLKGVPVGVIRDYSYGEEFDVYVKKHENEPALIQIVSGDDALQKNVNKLIAGRIKAVLEDRAVMKHYLAANSLNDKITLAGSLGAENVYIAFSPKNPKSAEYAKTLSEGITALRESGELKSILSRYGINEQAPPS